MSKPREFWIGRDVANNIRKIWHSEPSSEEKNISSTYIVEHVIEHSAYEKALRTIRELAEALEWCANVGLTIRGARQTSSTVLDKHAEMIARSRQCNDASCAKCKSGEPCK